MHHLRRVLIGTGLTMALQAALAPGCGSSGGTTTHGSALDTLRDPSLTSRTRARAVGEAIAEAEQGGVDPDAVRQTLKDLAWSPATPNDLRIAALGALLRDDEHEGDAREMVRLMLPREPKDDAAALMSQVAAERGWTDATPALVRSLSRHNVRVPDEQRPEWLALEQLHPGRSVAEVAYGVFLDPQTDAGSRAIKWDERTRADAWDLLARLDPTGERRAGLILGTDLSSAPDETRPVVGALRAALDEFRAVPITGDELRWLLAIRESSDPRAAAWWSESASAIRRLSPGGAGRIELRHVEPIRWAAAHRPEWLEMSRDALLGEVESRVDTRRTHIRAGRHPLPGMPGGETVDVWRDRLRFGDAISLLVIDEALAEPAVRAEIARQAGLDRADTSTEYGGIVEWHDGRWRAALYAPRPNQRVNDHTFVASDDMIAASHFALLHYHLHVQTERNTGYAGPSEADLVYAARSGRNCAVLTSVARGAVDADVYMPNGMIIDLGEIAISPAAPSEPE